MDFVSFLSSLKNNNCIQAHGKVQIVAKNKIVV